MRTTTVSAFQPIEVLESRQLMAAQISYPDFSSVSGLSLHGVNGTADQVNNTLRLTDNNGFESRSVWYGTAVPVKTFKSDFSFKIGSGATTADGITFTIQGDDANQVGQAGKYLGYSGIRNSAAVSFNMYNNGGFGSRFGYLHNGQVPGNETDLSPIDLHSGHLFHATVSYDGHNMVVNVTDASNRSNTFSATRVVDVPTLVGTDTAFVGFTASTGVNMSNQFLTSWDYTGSNGPTIATAAAANPNPVTGKTTALSVLGADTSGESTLKYIWSTVTSPSGAKAVTFAPANGTNDAKSITATFFKAGTYTFKVTATDITGLSASSLVTVIVDQTASELRVDPHKATLAEGASKTYVATAYDQFNHVMRTQPTFSYAETGPGSIVASTGVFTASNTQFGHVVITATAGDLSGTVGATVLQPA